MGWSRALTKDFILFCKLVQPSPSSLQLPSLRHCHHSCHPHRARSYFGRHHQCRHHRHHLSRPCDWPGGAGPMMRGIPTPGRQLALTWGDCCWHLCSRRHLPCQPTVVAAVAAAAACQRWRRRRCWQHGNKVNDDNNNNNMTTTQHPTRQPTRQPTWRGDN
jgi:hypothetical protein